MAGPKLLDKKLVNAELANQKKQQIDSGIMLAKKVDVVREMHQTEEQNLEIFRKETITRVQQEIDALIHKRDVVKKEIQEREKELKFLKIPLDAEWENLKASYLKYSDQVNLLEAAKETVALQIGENTMTARELEIEKGRVQEMKRITQEKLFHAEDDLSRAREESAKMRNMAQSVLSSAELREQLVIQRENDFKITVEHTNSEKQQIEKDKIDLAKREKVLKDRYATLERTLKRMKK